MRNYKVILKDSIYVFYSFDGERVFIANPESKKCWSPVQRISETKKGPELISNDGFKIKFEGGKVKVLLGDTYFTLGNVHECETFSQLSGITITDGVVENVVFGFSEELPDQTVLLFENSELCKEAKTENFRKVTLSLKSKTTKYKVGYRYDGVDGSFVYLGMVNSFNNGTSYHKVPGIAHVFSSCLDKKSVEEYFIEGDVMFTNVLREYGDTLLVIQKPKPLAEFGELFKDTGVPIESLWEDKITRFREKMVTGYSLFSGHTHFSNVDKKLFNSFRITTNPDGHAAVTEKTKEMILDIIRRELKFFLLKYHGVNNSRPQISGDFAQRTNSLIAIFLDYCMGGDSNGKDMLHDIFGVDLEEESKRAIQEFELLSVHFVTFEDLIDNFCYFQVRNDRDYFKELDFVYISDKSRRFDFFLKKDSLYLEVIKDIYKHALETSGENVEKYSVVNVGTVKTPCLEYRMIITLENIKNFFGVESIHDIPQRMKDDMLENKIYQVEIRTREDLTVHG